MKKPTKRYKGFQYEDGYMIKTAYFDGYAFGDRILEGVVFKATINKQGRLEVTPDPKDEAYLADLNRKKWLAEALTYAEGNDLFSVEPGGDLEVELIPE